MSRFPLSMTLQQPQPPQAGARPHLALQPGQLGAMEQPMPPHFGSNGLAPHHAVSLAADPSLEPDEADWVCCRGMD